MHIDHTKSYPLPNDPLLAEAATALNEAGHWATITDAQNRLLYATDEIRRTFGGLVELAPFAIGEHQFGPEHVRASQQLRLGSNTIELQRRWFASQGGMALATTPGGRDELRELVDPALRDIVDDLSPTDSDVFSFSGTGMGLIGPVEVSALMFRIRDNDGTLRGTVLMTKPAPGMGTIGAMTSMGDLRHLERMQRVAYPDRRPAAILFADLEASSMLSRSLSTASYFALGRRLVRAADACIVDRGGLVGRHVGDGVVAYFLAEDLGSESSAARACLEAARTLSASAREVAARSDLAPEDVVLRFGLHWGSTLYVGNISTVGRSEVTALGDEVNEAARIEACATGGRVLASKVLLERLDPGDAAALDLDPDTITYTRLNELATATEKARRDAPAIAVTDVGAG